MSHELSGDVGPLHDRAVLRLTTELERRGAREPAIGRQLQIHGRELNALEAESQLIPLPGPGGPIEETLRRKERYLDLLLLDLDSGPEVQHPSEKTPIDHGERHVLDESTESVEAHAFESQPIESSSVTAFVGRDRILMLLRHDLVAAQHGSGRMCLITGEMGIGKSRLMSELRLQAEGIGAIVLSSAFRNDGAGSPRGVFAGALERYVAMQPLEVRRTLAISYPALTVLLPSLTFDAVVEESSRNPGSDMVSALVGLLTRLAEDRPILFLLDDIHLAAPTDLDLIYQLARVTPGRRWFIAASWHQGDIAAGSLLQGMSRTLTRDGLCRRIELRTLGRQDVARLLAAHIRDENPGESFLNRVYNLTGGNPRLIHQVMTTSQNG